MPQCLCVPVFPCDSGCSVSLCLRVPLSQCPYVSVSPCLRVPVWWGCSVSPCLHVPMSPCDSGCSVSPCLRMVVGLFHVPVSPCPHVPAWRWLPVPDLQLELLQSQHEALPRPLLPQTSSRAHRPSSERHPPGGTVHPGLRPPLLCATHSGDGGQAQAPPPHRAPTQCPAQATAQPPGTPHRASSQLGEQTLTAASRQGCARHVCARHVCARDHEAGSGQDVG